MYNNYTPIYIYIYIYIYIIDESTIHCADYNNYIVYHGMGQSQGFQAGSILQIFFRLAASDMSVVTLDDPFSNSARSVVYGKVVLLYIVQYLIIYN